MRISPYLTDEAVLEEVGARIERLRLERNLTQEELAANAGVTRRTVVNLESGKGLQFVTVLRVLRALGLIEGLEQLVPEPVPGPVDLLHRQGHPRSRASRRRAAPEADTAGEPFRWGDETRTQ